MFFKYEVLNRDQQTIKGKVEANSRTNAISLLHSKGYTIINLKQESEGSAFDIKLFQRVRTKDLIIFSRQIATLFEAEISALRAFNLVAENVQNEYFKDILHDIARSIEQGSSIESSFTKYKNTFGEFFVAIVAIGEQSGTLPRSFLYLANYVERNAETTRTIRKALTYPAFVIVMFFAVMILMFVSVIPQISTILLQSGAELPTITKIVLGISDFLKNNITILGFCFVGVVIAFIWYIRTEDGRRSFDYFAVTLPLFGKLFRQFYLVRLTGNLGVMLSSGVPIVKSLDILARVMTNTAYRDLVEEVGKNVQQGATLSSSLENQPLIGKNVSQIIRIGEEAGELTKMLSVITDFYDQQLKDTISTLLDLIQPTVIVLLGLGVGVLIGSVILPIYSISASI